jgi:ABC-type transport system substrate-binding protein
MVNKKLTSLIFLGIFCCLFISGVPTYAQVNAVPELRYPLWVLSWDDISVDTGSGIQLQMIPIGVGIDIDIKDDDPMYEGIYQIPRTFQMYEMSHGYDAIPDMVWFRMHSDNILDWGDNCYGINNASVDSVLDTYMSSTPATIQANAEAVQIIAKEHVPYIPLFLSDDTHAIRAQWTNFTLKPGGVFTKFNPQTMIYMYNTSLLPTGGSISRTGIEFIMAYPSDIGELNPLFARSERSNWYNMLIYDTLISYDVDMNPIPWLAESWSVNTAGTQVNFTIDPTDKFWHDMTPLTVQDVNFSMHYWKNAPEDTNFWSFLQKITSTAIDGNTLVINLDTPQAFGLETLGSQIFIVPKHIREGIPADDARWDDPTNPTYHTGSGPWVFVARTPDEFTSMIRFADWWGEDVSYIGQLPNIERVRIDVVRGQDARILAMRAGEADSERYEVFGAYVNTILNAPELQLVTGLASQWDYVLGFATNYSVPGFEGLGLEDVRVRRAMALAINRQQLVNIGRLGFGTVTNSVIPYAFYPNLYSPLGAWEEDDVAGANAILDAAGYIDVDGDGIREFPGVVIPPPPPNLLLIGVAAVVALVIGIVIAYVVLRMRK